MSGELKVGLGPEDPRWSLVGILLATCICLSACTSSANLRASGLGSEERQSLEQALQTYQWGGWYRVDIDTEVAHVQQQAMAHGQAGEPEKALQVLNLGLHTWPDSGALLECRASLYGALGYWRAAECDFDKATRLRPKRACSWEALGRCRQELGLWNAARSARSEAQRLSLIP